MHHLNPRARNRRRRCGGAGRQAWQPGRTSRELCYRLYTACERKKRETESLAYHGLIQSWLEIARIAHEGAQVQMPTGRDLISGGEGQIRSLLTVTLGDVVNGFVICLQLKR